MIFNFLKQWGKTWEPFSSLPNFGKVSDDLYRGGQPVDPTGYVKLVNKYHIKVIINLIADESLEELKEVEDLCYYLGIQWRHIPLYDNKPPTKEQVEEFFSIIEHSKGAVFVHCKGGRHRTSLMIAMWRVVAEFWSKEDAWHEAKDGYGYYNDFGHKTLEDYFFKVFDPEDYRKLPVEFKNQKM